MLRAIGIGVLVYIIYRVLSKIIFPNVSNASSGAGGRQSRYNNAQSQEGRIKVTKRPGKGEEKHVTGGEYVDFEDVD